MEAAVSHSCHQEQRNDDFRRFFSTLFPVLRQRTRIVHVLFLCWFPALCFLLLILRMFFGFLTHTLSTSKYM